MSLLESVQLPSLDGRQPITIQSSKYLLLAFSSYYATAVLVLLPRTFALRLAIFPVTLLLTFRAATLIDFSSGNTEFAHLNQGLVIAMVTIFLRTSMWTFRLEPLRGRKLPDEPNQRTASTRWLMSDAFDLFCNLRGIGWSWSDSLRIPQETRDVTSTPSFLFSTFVWFLRDVIAFDFCHYIVQWFSPNTIGSPQGGTIYDPSFQPLPRYVRSTVISFFGGWAVYTSINAMYNFGTLIGILVFRQAPTQWPPISDQPWRATSLNQFWAIRWHQLFRDIFIACGSTPVAYVAGRVGGVVGAFLLSGLLHDMGCWGMGRGTDFKSISGFFFMNAVGVILEHVYKSITGKRVGGFAGWVWTCVWLVGWGGMLVDAWMSRGVGGSVFFPSGWRPAFFVLGPF